MINSTPLARWVIAAQYFLYFGVMGIHLPYFNLYCYKLGFSGWQIGVLSAARSIILIVFAIFWSIIADHFQARRQIYILCNFISATCWILFLLTTDFWLMLVATVAYGIFYAPLISFQEAFAMEVLAKQKKHYGRLRAWGSLAFICVVLAMGRIIEIYSTKIIISLILAGSWVQALVSIKFPKVPLAEASLFQDGLRRLFTPEVAVFLICGFLMLLSHAAYYAFFSIHLSNLGYDGFFIGLCWAVAVGAEFVTMVFSKHIFKRISYETVIALSFIVAVLRWTGLWISESDQYLLLLQVSHAVTYGAFHMASILYMDKLMPEGAKTLGQAVNNAVTYGLGLMAGFFISGAMYEKFGSNILFAASAGIALLGGGLFLGAMCFRRLSDRPGTKSPQ
ncbi:MAG: MFS transporter [Desulfobacteraceae bacterium]|nr:MFS transporter [Desulfobacteraceae bacterium]